MNLVKPYKSLGEILLEDGVIKKEDLEKALNQQKKEGGLLGIILVNLGILTEEQLIFYLKKQ